MKNDQQPNRQSSLLRLVSVWLFFYVVLTFFFHYSGSVYINWMLPLVRGEIEWVSPGYTIREIKLVDYNVEYHVAVSRPVVRPDGVVVQQNGHVFSAVTAHNQPDLCL